MNIPAILETLRPGASWTLNGETYVDLDWGDTVQVKPTETEVTDAWVSVELALIDAGIIQQRSTAYRVESDPIFFKWQRGEATEQAWLDKVQQIRERYPYPEE